MAMQQPGCAPASELTTVAQYRLEKQMSGAKHECVPSDSSFHSIVHVCMVGEDEELLIGIQQDPDMLCNGLALQQQCIIVSSSTL